jgi:hypothetical protein
MRGKAAVVNANDSEDRQYRCRCPAKNCFIVIHLSESPVRLKTADSRFVASPKTLAIREKSTSAMSNAALLFCVSAFFVRPLLLPLGLDHQDYLLPPSKAPLPDQPFAISDERLPGFDRLVHPYKRD